MGAALLIPLGIAAAVVGTATIVTVIGLSVYIVQLKKQKIALEELIEKERHEIKRISNFKNIDAEMKKKLNELAIKDEKRQILLKHVINYLHYNFGFVGRSGVGKSSLLNAIIHKKVAQVNIKEETSTFNKYDVPYVDFIKLWDCPGFGTTKFPFDQHKDKILRFDFLLVIIDSRIHEFDIDLLKEAIANKIPVALVRSKSDQDVETLAYEIYDEDKYSLLNKQQKADVQQKCRQTVDEYIKTTLRNHGLESIKYFYVSSKVMRNGDANYPKFDDDEFIQNILQAAATNKPFFEDRLMQMFEHLQATASAKN